MDKNQPNNPKQRRYPGVYEKGVPIILAIIVVLMIILAGIAVAVIINFL
jgi:hypothetical protein